MDGQRFDGLAKRLVTGATRRGVVGGVLAVGAGIIAARTVGAEKPASPGKSACQAGCKAEFPGEEEAGPRGRCVSACVRALASGNSTCKKACKEEFPSAKGGARRGCIQACKEAEEEVAA